MRLDDPNSYTFDLFGEDPLHNTADRVNLGFGVHNIWNYGEEIWCNQEGQYLHIVANLTHLAGEKYEMSICSLGVMGTKYIRDGDPVPQTI